MQSNIFNINNILNLYHSRIIEVCSKIPGQKTLMIDDDVSKIINRICGRNLLEKVGITKVIKIADYSIDKNIQKLICFLPSNTSAVRKIVSFLKNDKENNIKRTMVLGFVPYLTESSLHLLNKEELPLERVGICDLRLGWLPLDDDLLTMNWPQLYMSSFLHQNTSDCYFLGQMLADALVIGLERPTYTCKIYALGEQSKWCFKGLYDECDKNNTNYKTSDSKTGTTNVFIFSRDVDYVTPFCLPVTFEAMIHEVIGIDLDTVTLTREMTNDNEDKKELMNSTNTVFKDTRFLPLTLVGPKLRQISKELEDIKNKVDVLKRPDDLQKFVTNEMKQLLRQNKEISHSFNAYYYVIDQTTVKDRVDDLMCAQASLLVANEDWEFPRTLIIEFLTCKFSTKPMDALRLLCLWTATHDGLPTNVYTEMCRLLCHSVGYPIMQLLHNLRRLRLLAPHSDFLALQQTTQPTASSIEVLMQSGTTATVSAASSASLQLQQITNNIVNSASANNLSAMKNMVIAQKSHFYNLKNCLRLYSNRQIQSSKDCMHNSYIFGGHHSPLCSALIEEICHKTAFGAPGNMAATSAISGPQLASGRKAPPNQLHPLDEAMKHLNLPADSVSTYGRSPLGSGTSVREAALDTIIVCFVGGCTYAEIAAVRQMAAANRWNVVILTSSILKIRDLIMQARLDD